MNIDELKSQILPVLLTGTRSDVGDRWLALGPDREGAALNALSLAGQALRFLPPTVPKEFAVELWPRDERRILPDRLRAGVLRLLDRSTDDTARALAFALERQKLRPHPFDLPRLSGFVGRYAGRLGATAQHWAQRESPAQQAHGYFEVHEVNANNWTEGSLRQRVQFLEALRKQDPEGARKLLENSWPGENPDSRVQFLSTLHLGLSAGDRAFLESIQKDRAPRVRSLSHRLMATLSGGDSDNPALAACMERIRKSRAGLLKKRHVLKLELPATLKEHEVNRWIYEQFADVNVGNLARACEMSEHDLIESAGEDNNLLFALSLMASREMRFDLLDAVTNELPDAWGRMSELNWEDDAARNDESTSDWANALVKPNKWLPELPFPAWSWLHRQLDGPLPTGIMRELLNSKVWTEQLEQEKKGGAELVQVICALCPRDMRGIIRAQLEPLEVDRKDKGAMLLDILDELETLK